MKEKSEPEQKFEQEQKWKKERIRIGEKRAELKPGFIDRCERILEYFDDSQATLMEFIFKPVEPQDDFIYNTLALAFHREPLSKKNYETLDCITKAPQWEIEFEGKNIPIQIAFAVGYVLGSTLDPTDPHIQKDIQVVKEVIKECQIVPYFPREKKAA